MNTDDSARSLPVVALVGRPNVGKSTLFNRLTRSRDALVADMPGLTRDRKYGFGKLGAMPFVVIDTGGLENEADGLMAIMAKQTLQAISEADVLVFMVDGRAGLSAADEQIAEQLRRFGKPIVLALNKTEGLSGELAGAEFHALGLGEPCAISAAHGDGISQLLERLLSHLDLSGESSQPAVAEDPLAIRVAVIGRPNVGKSTLINRLLGEERLVAFDQPGTTRDSVSVPFERAGRQYRLIDTAGVRRRSRVKDAVEKFSIVKTLQAIDRAQVVIAVLDASEGVGEQDASLIGLAIERGRAIVVAINKWDGLSQDQRDTVRRHIDLKLPFLGFARMHFISALHGSGVGDLLASVNEAHAATTRDLATPELTRELERAVTQHQPPLVNGRRIKLRFAHQGGRNPPIIVIHGNQAQAVPDSYRRFLMNRFRDAFNLYGTPIRIEFRSGENPFAGRRNTLTPRQLRKKKRLSQFTRRRR